MPTNEQKTLIFVVTFISCFFLLLSFMPSYFYSQTSEGLSYKIPEYFESVDVQSFAEYKNFSLTTNYDKQDTIGGHNIYIRVRSSANGIMIATYERWWIFTWGYDWFHWYDCQGIDRTTEDMDMLRDGLKWDDLDAVYNKSDEQGLRWVLKNGKTQLVVYFGFNTTKYSKPSEAIGNNDLHILICISFDQVNTSINAWNLIGQLLTFKMPNVHPLINALIAIPIWVAIAWLVTIFILKFIPFVGGG